MSGPHTEDVTYILPIKASRVESADDFAPYLRWLAGAVTEVLVIDASEPGIFERHAAEWGSFVRHVAPRSDFATPMGKVGNVLTGIELARCDKLIIADDDVRYDEASLRRVATALDEAEVVRPQN